MMAFELSENNINLLLQPSVHNTTTEHSQCKTNRLTLRPFVAAELHFWAADNWLSSDDCLCQHDLTVVSTSCSEHEVRSPKRPPQSPWGESVVDAATTTSWCCIDMEQHLGGMFLQLRVELLPWQIVWRLAVTEVHDALLQYLLLESKPLLTPCLRCHMPPTKNKELTKNIHQWWCIHCLGLLEKSAHSSTPVNAQHTLVSVGWYALPAMRDPHSFIDQDVLEETRFPKLDIRRHFFIFSIFIAPMCISFPWAGTTVIRLTEQKRMWFGGKHRSCLLPFVRLLSYVCSCIFLFLFWSGCNPDCCN